MKKNNFEIDYVSVNDLNTAPWQATYTLKPDLAVIRESLIDFGWLYPILVRRATNTIIDGHHRVYLAETDKALRKRDKGMVPVRFVDCSEVEAMLLHARINRGRGEVLAQYLSHIIKNAMTSRAYTDVEIMRMFKMSTDEMDILSDGTLVKKKKIAEHQYSRGWVPVEAPANIRDQAAIIERPPNPDR
jgi:hypothetical protein